MVTCIVNPTSAGGRTASLLPHLREGLVSRFGTESDLFVTAMRGDARRRTMEVLQRSPDATIVVVGGDGTFQEVANGWMDPGVHASPNAAIGFVNSGTGQGLAQGMGLPTSLREQLNLLVHGKRCYMDLGVVSSAEQTGIRQTRYFVNECQLGIGGAVVHAVERHPKRLSGRWTFGLSALRQALTLPNRSVVLVPDGGPPELISVLGLVFGNGAYTGGGMHLTPGATPFDGCLDLLVMGAQSVCRRLSNLSRIYSARHIGRREFSLRRCRTATVTSPEPIDVEADGEYLGSTPCSVAIVSSAFPVIVPSGVV